MEIAHRDAPIRHTATRIRRRNFHERLLGLFIFKRVQPGDGAIELFLRLWCAGNGEVNAAQFFRRFVTVIAVLGLSSDDNHSGRYCEKESAFQGGCPFRGRRLF